jgi:hypothetical protein
MTIFRLQNSVALDGNPEPDLVHATGCKQSTLIIKYMFAFSLQLLFETFFMFVAIWARNVRRK